MCLLGERLCDHMSKAKHLKADTIGQLNVMLEKLGQNGSFIFLHGLTVDLYNEHCLLLTHVLRMSVYRRTCQRGYAGQMGTR